MEERDKRLKEIQENLSFNYLIDQKKRKVDYLQRAKIIREFLNTTGWSGRRLAAELGIPKSTIEDWLLWDRLDEEQYKELKENLGTDTKIYRKLRNNKNKSIPNIINSTRPTPEIDQVLTTLKRLLASPPNDRQYIIKLEEAKNIINRIIMRIEKRT